MNLIDDNGRILGTINIVDALVVLLVLAVVAAGTAFVLQSDNGGTPENGGASTERNTSIQNATRYATVDLGTQPSHLVERLTEGDTGTQTNLTVTDVYRIPTNDGVRTWVRVRLDGQVVGEENATEFAFAGGDLERGDALSVATEEYQFNGTIRNLVPRNSALPRQNTEVVLRTTTETGIADAIQAGNTYTVANGTVATVESVTIYPTEKATKKRVVLGASLETLNMNGQREFLGRPVRIGQKLPFRTDAYAITGRVVHRGSTSLPGERTTSTVTLKLSGVAPEIADGIATGMSERADGTARARITDKRVEPATVVLRSQNGTIHEREHPTKQDVYLTVELDARQTDGRLYFHDKRLREGGDLLLDLESITVHGQVIDVGNEDEETG